MLAGLERVRVDPQATAFTPLDFEHYPWSHSLVMSLVWSLVAFGGVWLARRSPREAGVVAALVVSHRVLDFFTHRPDLPLLLDGPKVGLGLWNSVAATFLIETAIFGIGAWLFVRSTAPRNRTGRWAFVGLIGFLLLVHVGNAFGPRPAPGTPPAGIAGPAWQCGCWWPGVSGPIATARCGRPPCRRRPTLFPYPLRHSTRLMRMTEDWGFGALLPEPR